MNKLVFTKSIQNINHIYVSIFTKSIDLPYLIFVHGGPGLNCGVIEYLTENHNYFSDLNFNLIFYDQRGCGRSTNNSDTIIHNDNVKDLNDLIIYLKRNQKIAGIIGHSYGGKILFDYCCKYDHDVTAIFVATPDSFLIPRMNNLLFDFYFLKKSNDKEYLEILSELDQNKNENIWSISHKFKDIFDVNVDRKYLYWADMKTHSFIDEVKEKVNLIRNDIIFENIREEMYLDLSNLTINYNQLKNKYIRINGFQDMVMGLPNTNSENTKIFIKSAHYPHIEENEVFSELLNSFV